MGSSSSSVPLDENLQFLANVPLFKGFPKEIYPSLSACTQTVHFDAGQVIIQQGQVGDEFFVIKTGKASVVVDGAEITELQTSDCVGYNEPRPATITALSSIDALKISRKAYDEIQRMTYGGGPLAADLNAFGADIRADLKAALTARIDEVVKHFGAEVARVDASHKNLAKLSKAHLLYNMCVTKASAISPAQQPPWSFSGPNEMSGPLRPIHFGDDIAGDSGNDGGGFGQVRALACEGGTSWSWRVDLPPERLVVLRRGESVESPPFRFGEDSSARFFFYPKGDQDCSVDGMCSLWVDCVLAGEALGPFTLLVGDVERANGASEFCALEDVLRDGGVEVSLRIEATNSGYGSGGTPGTTYPASEGWEAYLDPNTERVYYWHTETEEVCWDHPPAAETISYQPAEPESADAMPSGREEPRDPGSDQAVGVVTMSSASTNSRKRPRSETASDQVRKRRCGVRGNKGGTSKLVQLETRRLAAQALGDKVAEERAQAEKDARVEMIKKQEAKKLALRIVRAAA